MNAFRTGGDKDKDRKDLIGKALFLGGIASPPTLFVSQGFYEVIYQRLIGEPAWTGASRFFDNFSLPILIVAGLSCFASAFLIKTSLLRMIASAFGRLILFCVMYVAASSLCIFLFGLPIR